MATSAPTSADPLSDAALMAEMIAEVTGQPVERVMQRLRMEHEKPGITVRDDFCRRGLTPYLPRAEDLPGADRFYAETDAFLYETAVWNHNRAKRHMRTWIIRRLRAVAADHGKPALEVLVLGDGMGFDSVILAYSGHNVTYFELPGIQIEFARRLFELAGESVRMVTDPREMEGEMFDAVIALDVLEHVPDPPAFVRMMAAYLRPGGVLVSHAPFYMIHPAYPTHLLANRRYSGSLKLYTEAGLKLVDARPFWNPLALQKPLEGARGSFGRGTGLRLLLMRAVGLYLALGRFAAWPFRPVHYFRRLRNRWFG